MRSCVGCRSRQPAGTLVRVALRKDGSLVVSREAPGRGAWLCRDPRTGFPSAGCFEAAKNRKAFNRAYRTDVTEDATRQLSAFLAERAIIESGADDDRHTK